MDFNQAKDLLLIAALSGFLGGFLRIISKEFKNIREDIHDAVKSIKELNSTVGQVLVRLENHDVRLENHDVRLVKLEDK